MADEQELAQCSQTRVVEKSYLESVREGDILYCFPEGNKKYIVKQVKKTCLNENPVLVESVYPPGKSRWITLNGTRDSDEPVPYYLFQPVSVLDPDNLPERPWMPEEGEWVWASQVDGDKIRWFLARFAKRDTQKQNFLVVDQGGVIRETSKIAPFEGKLPPGLEE